MIYSDTLARRGPKAMALSGQKNAGKWPIMHPPAGATFRFLQNISRERN